MITVVACIGIVALTVFLVGAFSDYRSARVESKRLTDSHEAIDGLFIGAAVVILIAFFAVLFTGTWPEGMRDYVVGVNRWALRVFAYFIFLTDAYPPFSLQ